MVTNSAPTHDVEARDVDAAGPDAAAFAAVDVGEVFDALGDGTRRAIVERLRRGPLPVNEIAEALPVSRPAVSKHLRLLKEAGVVEDRAVGTRRFYALRLDALAAARDQLDRFWGDALERFRDLAEPTTPSEEPDR